MRRRHPARSRDLSVINTDGHAIGLDLGATGVRAAILSHPEHERGSAASVHGLGEAPLSAGAVVNGVVVNQAVVTKAVRDLWEERKFNCRNVILGITNQQVVVRDLQVPRLDPAQLAKALPFQAREVVPLPMDQVVLDFLPLGDDDPSSDTVTGLLVATPRQPVAAAVAAVERAGLHVARVDLSSFAALRSIADENLAVEAVVDLGAQLTSIVVHAHGIPRVVRTVTRGGEELNERLVERADLSPADAERAKREVGLTGTHRDVVTVLTDGLRPLMAEIRSSMHYFGSMNPGLRIERLALTGGGAGLPGLAEALAAQTGVPTLVVPALQHIRNRWANRDVRELEQQRTATAVSVGLAMGAAA